MHTLSDKSYQSFNPDERIRLVISALARDDKKETESLLDTTPRHFYSASDLDFWARFNAMMDLSYMFTIDCARIYNIIKKAEFNHSLIKVRVIEAPETYDAEDEETLKIWEQRINEQTLILKSFYEGLIAFCKEMDINSEDFLKRLDLKCICHDINEYLSAEVETYPELVRRAKNKYIEIWKIRNKL